MKTYNQDIEKVFKTISDHSRFLSGGGLQCEMIKLGNDNPNGEGAILLKKPKNSPKSSFPS